MPIAYQYTADGYYAGKAEDHGLVPNNATHFAPPEPQEGWIPRWTGERWTLAEDHKGKQGYINGESYTINEYGPPPEGWSDTPPPPALAEVVSGKQAAIRAGYDTALSGVLAGADATATGVAVGSALMAVTDPDGLEYLVDLLTARRVALEQALLAAQAEADAVAAVLAIVVSYPT